MIKIFFGGFSGSGSRVPMRILQRAGYFVGHKQNLNEQLDLYPTLFGPAFDKWFFNNNPKPLKDLLHESLSKQRSWAIKHGYLQMCIPLLKKWYPDSKFVITVRHPIDNMLNKYEWHKKYGGLRSRSSIENKVKYHQKITNQAMKHADMIIRLEDMCFKPHESIKNLFDFAKIKDNPNNYTDIIQVPNSIGRGIKYYDKVKTPIIKKLGYGDMPWKELLSFLK